MNNGSRTDGVRQTDFPHIAKDDIRKTTSPTAQNQAAQAGGRFVTTLYMGKQHFECAAAGARILALTDPMA
jgi:hypothetical protein